MATVTSASPAGTSAETQRRVAHPLERLRSIIRTYVSLEGLAVLCLYVALWFWIGLALDYGFFKTFGVDWVQELPWGFRAFVLAVLTLGLLVLVVRRMVLRLTREFHPRALALVLERRFPKELGDRLITAVEMADPQIADRYGYSQTMIDQTIRDAADRVERLPVRPVFNWSRLRRYGLRALALTLGLYLLVGAVYCVAARSSAGDFMSRFGTVAGIWFERNVLLQDTIWPRRAYLELVDFPESGDLRVGRDAPPPTLHVRAIKWVVADRHAPEGWRALRVDDLTPELAGHDLSPLSLPVGWKKGTVDQMEIELDKPETLGSLAPEVRLTLRDVFAKLEEKAESPAMARRLRRLIIPDVVTVYYRGETIRSEQSLKKQGENDYAGVLSDLRESVRFTANGEDYYTPPQRITIVPPPNVVELTRDEEQPAYLFHRPPLDGQLAALKGRRQIFTDQPISLSGSASRFEVPTGTNVVLKGKSDKPLKPQNGVRLRAREGSGAVNPMLRQTGDQAFEARFDHLTAALQFDIELVDLDNVVGHRMVIIKPVDDTPPEVDVLVEVIRKTNAGYLVTPSAKIPISGKARDDHGIDRLDYVYTLTSLDSQGAAAARPIGSIFQFVPRGMGPMLTAPAYLTWVGAITRAMIADANRPPESVPVGTFERRLKEKAQADVPLPELIARLKKTPLALPPKGRDLDPAAEFLADALLKDHNFDPEEEFFDVEKLRLKVSDEDKTPQPHYRMRLWVEARDNNVETGPAAAPSKDKFLFLIVSENELLLEIAKEEESLHIKLEDTVNKLKDARNKLEQVSQELPSLKPDEFSPMARRIEEIVDAQVKGMDVTREVWIDYRRILKELQVNRVHPKIIEKVEKNIVEPLEGTINQEFVRSDESMRAFLKVLDDKKADKAAADLAKAQLDQLIARLTRILDAMGDLTTINKLIEQLVEIIKQEEGAAKRFKELKDRLEEDILNQALQPSGTPEKKKE